MSTAPLHSERRFTYGDYLTWPDTERWELIDGIAYSMTPPPGTEHQSISFELSRQLGNWLIDKPCRAFAAPFGVRLPESGESDERTSNVVEPDLFVVCDKQKIDRRGVRGAPDFIIEIISPSSSHRDEIKKAQLYERHGVREYWVIYPNERLVHVRLLGADGKYTSQHRELKGKIAVSVLEGFELDFDLVLQQLAAIGIVD